jgi:hypothetical protein
MAVKALEQFGAAAGRGVERGTGVPRRGVFGFGACRVSPLLLQRAALSPSPLLSPSLLSALHGSQRFTGFTDGDSFRAGSRGRWEWCVYGMSIGRGEGCKDYIER